MASGAIFLWFLGEVLLLLSFLKFFESKTHLILQKCIDLFFLTKINDLTYRYCLMDDKGCCSGII